jgi:hypothetical protein
VGETETRNQTADEAAARTSWPETLVETWDQLQAAIEPIITTTGSYFRGQGDAAWPLQASFNRLSHGVAEQDALGIEMRAIMTFRSEAHLHLPPSVLPPSPFKFEALDTYVEWLMLMQHYGAPTRLLDWSVSPYVAAYFAVTEQPASDAVIWHFDQAPVARAMLQHYGRPVDQFMDYCELASADIRGTTAPLVVYTAVKKMRTAREIAQQGYFTFTNRIAASQQDAIPAACQGGPFGRIIIAANIKAQLAARLTMMNLTAAALFPGVDGICRAIHQSVGRDCAAWSAASPSEK